MSFLSIYSHTPVFVQNGLCSAAGYCINRKRFGGEYSAIDAAVSRRGCLSRDEVAAFRDERIAAFVRHTQESTPYYRKLFRDVGIGPGEIRDLDDLRKIPIVRKDVVQQNPDEFRSRDYDVRKCLRVHTSGTTGAGLVFWTTREAHQEQWATWWRYRRDHGIVRGTWCGYFGGRSVVPVYQEKPPFWRVNYAERQVMFSAYHMAPDNLEAYVEELARRQLPWLHGYPSSLALIANKVLTLRSGLGYRPIWVTVGAENLTESQSEEIAAAFGVKPVQHYGMAEAVANFSECTNGCLHVDEDFSAVEFVWDAQRHVHRIVGTNLSNPAYPLIRYDAGDLARVATVQCDCGNPGRTVESLDGRAEDYLELVDGAKVGRLDHIFKDMVHIREAQFLQAVPGKAKVRVVPGEHFSDADAVQLQRELGVRFGKRCEIAIEYVSALPRTASGKLRFVVREQGGCSGA